MPVQLEYLPVLDDFPPVGEGQPLHICLDLIDEDPAQPRREFAEKPLAELAATIAARGVRQPVSVRPHPDTPGRWLLNFGARRLRASRLAGKTEIPAFVDEQVDSYDQVIENEHREGLRPMELALFVKRQLEAGQSQADVARALSKSPAYVTCVSALINPPDWLMDAYRSGKCRGITELYDLRRMHAENPEAVMGLLRENDGVSRKDIARLRQQLSASPLAPQPAMPSAAESGAGKDLRSSPEGAALVQVQSGDQRRPASPRCAHIAVLGETAGGVVEIALDDLPSAADEVFVIDEGGGSQRSVKLSELHDLRLLRARGA